MFYIKTLIALASALSLASLSLYIYLAYRGSSVALYSTIEPRILKILPIYKKVFLILSAIGFLICMYQGAEAMLSWIPNNWGVTDEDGDFLPARILIATIFTLFGGLALMSFIVQATHDSYFINKYQINCKELKRIIEASSSSDALNQLVKEYASSIEALKNAENKNIEADLTNRFLFPEGQLIQLYRELIVIIERQQNQRTKTIFPLESQA